LHEAIHVIPLRKVLVVMTLALALTACHGPAGDSSKNVQTQTIAPAAAQPAPNGNDAMTQTVDVEDSRSVAEGGVTTTKPPAAAKKAPAPPKKKK
jgi:hypothetical protein